MKASIRAIAEAERIGENIPLWNAIKREEAIAAAIDGAVNDCIRCLDAEARSWAFLRDRDAVYRALNAVKIRIEGAMKLVPPTPSDEAGT